MARSSKEEDRSNRSAPAVAPTPPSRALFRRFSGTLFNPEQQCGRGGSGTGGTGELSDEPDSTADSAPNALGAPFSVTNLFRFVGMSRSAELCKYFDLPPTEVFLDDFNCALRKGIVLQGRMYIFDHYLCFSSFVFGFAKRVVIPLERVAAIKKKTHLRFPNSIKVEVSNDQGESESYFFTSFLSREDAFVLLSQRWVDTRPGAANMLEGGSPRRSATTSVVDTLSPHGFVHSFHQSSQLPGLREVSPGASGGGDGLMLSGTHQRSSVPRDYDDDEENDGCCCESVWGVVIDGAVPAIAQDASVVIQAVLEGTPQQLFEVLLADNSHMLEDFLEAQGNKRINLGGWKRDADVLGHVRDISFISPIKGAYANWGKATTQCYQSHRLRQFPGQYIVFESSQTMTDIPYGDCFTVDMRWDVSPLTSANTPSSPGDLPAPGGQTPPIPRSPFNGTSTDTYEPSAPAAQMRVDISVRVPFSRKCLWKSLIENGSKKQIKEQYLELVDQLREQLAQLGRDEQPALVGPAATAHSLAQRLSVALQPSTLPTVSSISNMFRHDAVSASLDAGHAGQGFGAGSHHVSRIGSIHGARGQLARSGGSHTVEPNTSSDSYPVKAGHQVAPTLAQRVQQALSWLSDVSSMCGFTLTMGQLVCLLVMLAVMVLQLVVFTGTMQAARSASRHAHQLASAPHLAQGVSGSTDGWVGDGVAAARKDMWAQRAALLEAELQLMQQHISAVAQQLQQARALSGQ